MIRFSALAIRISGFPLMPRLDFKLHCPLHDSFRVRQVAGMFDLPIGGTLHERFSVELPELDGPWTIGAIVGPSGSGKSAVAKRAFGEFLHRPRRWPANRAVIDCMGELPIHTITQTLTAVGLGSPPAWLKPLAVLSNGEKFRCELAAALLAPAKCAKDERIRAGEASAAGVLTGGGECDETNAPGWISAMSPTRACDHSASIPPVGTSAARVVAFDEFTSFVDRTVARIASAALSRSIRAGRINRRFIAISCHDDILPWLAPDWVLRMPGGTLARSDAALPRGRLRRPPLRLVIARAEPRAWETFRRHHYLSGELHPAARCFVGMIENRPAAFAAALPFPHPTRPGWREHRTVCLPDFQGVGIGNALSAFVASLFVATGKPYFSSTSHPAMVRHRASSALWRMTRRPGMVSRIGSSGTGRTGMGGAISIGRLTAGFEYVGPPRRDQARRLGVIG